MSDDKYIGIDLGTSNSSIAFHDGKSAQIIEMADTSLSLPSVIAFDDDNGAPLVGKSAQAHAKIAPLRSYSHVKRLIGRDWNAAEYFGPNTVEGPDGKVWLQGPDARYSPAQFMALIADRLLDAAEAKFAGERPTKAVLTVPASWKTEERVAAREAGKLAGLTDIVLLDEPSAAAIAYAAGRKKYVRIGVFDWGGGTFDFTVCKGKGALIEVLGTNGNAQLGGKDVDELIVQKVLKDWYDKYQVDLGVRVATMPRIRSAAEEAKIALTENMRSTVKVDFVDSSGPDDIKNMNEPLTREEFNEMAVKLVDMCFEPMFRVLEELGMTPRDLDEVILVGGMTRVPLVWQRVEEVTGKKPRQGIAPEHAVALGAATYAAQLAGRGGDEAFRLDGKSAHSVWVETLNNTPHLVIPRGTPLPAEKKVTLTTSVDNQPVVGLHILEGDEDFSGADKLSLVAKDYPNVDLAPAGDPSVEFTFRRAADGSLSVLEGDRVIFDEAA